MQSAFPVERGSRGDHLKVVNAMRKVVSEAKGIQISAHLIRHGVQLYDIMNMQTGVLLLGAAGCGKTMLRRVMMETLRELNKEARLRPPVVNDGIPLHPPS